MDTMSGMTDRGSFIRRALVLFAVISAALLLWLLASGESVFVGFVTTDDSGYTGIARHLVEFGALPASTRTMGYPLVLALGYLVGGARWGAQLIVALQLVCNILLVYGLWKLIERMGPQEGGTAGNAGRGEGSECLGETNAARGGTQPVRPCAAIALGVFFLAGLGMALQIMTDFLAALFFFVFFYGMLFWRRRASLWLSAPALALATLTRPTFTLLPLILPLIARAVGKVRSPLPRLHLGVFIAASLAATGVSITYQYVSYGYLGPSSVVSFNLKTTLYHALAGRSAVAEEHLAGGASKERYIAGLDREIERRAGRPYWSLSKGEEERIMRGIFAEALRSHPGPIAGQAAMTFAKYLFVPVESIVSRFWALAAGSESYRTYGRIVLFVLFLPVWVLSLIPPIGAPENRRAYWVVMVVMLVYTIGISVIAPAQGERMRFTVLAFMLPVMVWNAGAIRFRLSSSARS